MNIKIAKCKGQISQKGCRTKNTSHQIFRDKINYSIRKTFEQNSTFGVDEFWKKSMFN